ncbi:MAG: hypothetical protein KJZ78_26045 [Bryobacteraceae bacterium]|nr:hypothetical protein [Bryobacteraceae bacterium]
MAKFNFFTASKGFEDESVWLTQAAIADLFQTTPQNITLHIGAIYEEGELREEATCKEYLQVRQEGSRKGWRWQSHRRWMRIWRRLSSRQNRSTPRGRSASRRSDITHQHRHERTELYSALKLAPPCSGMV